MRSPARPVVTISDMAPARVLGKLGTVTVLMRSVSNGVTAVAAKQADTALRQEGDGGGRQDEQPPMRGVRHAWGLVSLLSWLPVRAIVFRLRRILREGLAEQAKLVRFLTCRRLTNHRRVRSIGRVRFSTLVNDSECLTS